MEAEAITEITDHNGGGKNTQTVKAKKYRNQKDIHRPSKECFTMKDVDEDTGVADAEGTEDEYQVGCTSVLKIASPQLYCPHFLSFLSWKRLC